MKTTTKVARIITWFNLVVWGGMLAMMLLYGLAAAFIPMIIAVFLFSSIPLHSYAALKLQKSIRHPQIKLSHQTPVGVRFIGFVALFFGICTVANTFVIISDPRTALKPMEASIVETKGLSESEMAAVLRVAASFVMLMGTAVIVNVILNMRLLRWYYLVKRSDVS
jgi:hypothetical protein